MKFKKFIKGMRRVKEKTPKLMSIYLTDHNGVTSDLREIQNKSQKERERERDPK